MTILPRNGQKDKKIGRENNKTALVSTCVNRLILYACSDFYLSFWIPVEQPRYYLSDITKGQFPELCVLAERREENKSSSSVTLQKSTH